MFGIFPFPGKIAGKYTLITLATQYLDAHHAYTCSNYPHIRTTISETAGTHFARKSHFIRNKIWTSVSSCFLYGVVICQVSSEG